MTRTTRRPRFTSSRATLVLLGLLALVTAVFLVPTAGAQSVKQVTVTCAKTQLVVPDSTTCSAKVRLSNGRYATNKTVKWISGTPGAVTVAPLTGGATVARSVAGGTSIISATADAITGSALLSVAGTAPIPDPTPTPTPIPAPAPGEAELPRVFLTTTVASTPSNGRILRVAGNVQAALDTACSGDRVRLDSAATFSGNYTLAPKSCGNAAEWITVESAGACPAEGTRVDTATARRLGFPRLSSPNTNRVLSTSGPAARWRFTCVVFTNAATLTQVNGTIAIGTSGIEQNTLAKVPSNIIFDRVVIHVPENTDGRNCLQANAARFAIVDSWVGGCKSAFDAQAFSVTNGPGPFKIVNNYLEGAAETIMFGGADPAIPNLVPSDIEIRRNHLFRPMTWRGKWLEKEHIESKNSSHALVEGNVFENTWIDGQYGWVMGLWSVNQDGSCTWCVTEHWTVRNNLARHVTSGFSLSGKYSTPSPLAHHLTITNNLLIGVDAPDIQGYGRLFQIQNVPNLTISHNTAFTPYNPTFSYDAGLMSNHIVRNNLVGGGNYQIFCGCGQGSVAWSQVAGPGSAFEGNVVALYPAWFNPIPNNEYPATLADIGLVGGATAAYSVTAQPIDLTLSATSAYKGKGIGGKDPGADVAAILAATQGVVRP